MEKLKDPVTRQLPWGDIQGYHAASMGPGFWDISLDIGMRLLFIHSLYSNEAHCNLRSQEPETWWLNKSITTIKGRHRETQKRKKVNDIFGITLYGSEGSISIRWPPSRMQPWSAPLPKRRLWDSARSAQAGRCFQCRFTFAIGLVQESSP